MKRLIFSLVIWCLATSVVLAATPSFGPPYRLTFDWFSTYDIASGDVDGDGRNDVVVSLKDGFQAGARLEYFLQRPDGTLSASTDVILPDWYGGHYRIELVDLDGDGALEVVMPTPDASGLLVAQLGTDGVSTVEHRAGPGATCKFMTTGDIDLDGNPDIVCHDVQLTASVYMGDGRGGFRSAYKFRTMAGWYILDYDFKTLQLADVTGDGYPDLLVSAEHSRAFHVYTNNRMGGFFAAVAYPHLGSISVAIHAADIDGDGLNEVLTATPENRPYSQLNVYRPGRYGYLEMSERIPVGDSPTVVLSESVGDVPGASLIVGHYTFNSISVVRKGLDDVWQQSAYELPGFGSHVDLGDVRRQYNIALADLDSDGCSDLAAATHAGVVLLYGCEPGKKSLPVNDFDGDGISDLIWHSPILSTLYLWQGAELKHWHVCRAPYPCPDSLGRYMEGQAVGDFDGDGNSDIFFRDPSSGENLLRLGAFYSRALPAVRAAGWKVVGAGDFDGDDKSDLLWRNDDTGANTIWRAASSTRQQRMRPVNDLRWKVAAVGDFDRDGRADIFWRHSTNGRNVIWLGGRYEEQVAAQQVTDTGWETRGVGDFNRDGSADLVWRNVRTGRNVIWLSAHGSRQVGVATVTNTDWDIATVGDYDGDGVSDLVWRNLVTGANVIWSAGNNKLPRPVAPMEADVLLVQ